MPSILLLVLYSLKYYLSIVFSKAPTWYDSLINYYAIMENLQNIRHSLAHLLASAVMEFWPKAKLGIGPAIENGFYYDIELPKDFKPEDLQKIENRMRELIKEKQEFTGKKISKIAARKLFKNQPYKLALIKELPGTNVGSYQNGNFTDLCKGGHISNTKEIDPNGFKLIKIAGAYWKGSEKNKMLTRIYGVAFATAKELQDYLKMQEEAEKRDHRILGQKLDLFVFSDLVGPGLPLFTPKGTTIRDLLDNYVWELRKTRGYEKVDIPHITKKELYETSGHWDKFKDELFRMNTREKHEFALKPMNCPHHIQIFNRKKWSYRELPQRYASTTKIYRDEQTGELFGLSRVRSITQDDAHVFVNMAGTEGEMLKIWEIIRDFYGTFSLPLKLRVSLRDKKQPQKYLGNPKIWDDAETNIREAARKIDVPQVEAPGEAAFYGPKLDFMVTDSLGREWQVATIQLDMVQPERFSLSFIRNDGQEGKIIMIHAAIMGSIERFMSILIEHYAGAFPVWLAPVQVAIIPISSEKHSDYANEITKRVQGLGFRVQVMNENESLGKKIREAEMQKIPYLLIIGDKEISANAVSVRQRSKGDLGQMPVDAFLEKMQKEITEKTV